MQAYRLSLSTPLHVIKPLRSELLKKYVAVATEEHSNEFFVWVDLCIYEDVSCGHLDSLCVFLV